jgi:hypothetical protein
VGKQDAQLIFTETVADLIEMLLLDALDDSGTQCSSNSAARAATVLHMRQLQRQGLALPPDVDSAPRALHVRSDAWKGIAQGT